MAELAIGLVAVLGASAFLVYQRRRAARQQRRRILARRLQALTNH